MDNRKEIYEKLKGKYQNLEFDSRYEGLLKLASPFYTRFKKNLTNFIGNIPEAGVLLFISNHSNVYDNVFELLSRVALIRNTGVIGDSFDYVSN